MLGKVISLRTNEYGRKIIEIEMGEELQELPLGVVDITIKPYATLQPLPQDVVQELIEEHKKWQLNPKNFDQPKIVDDVTVVYGCPAVNFQGPTCLSTDKGEF